MTYEESIQYLENIYWHGVKLGLDNIRRLLDRLGNPQQGLRIIHIAGTNGKGSAVAMLQSILRAAGYRVGAYTSPHLIRYNERFTIDGAAISDTDFAALMTEVAAACDALVAAGGTQPTVFEVLTAMAFLYFARQKADPVLLEVGMGGRFDATNVIEHPLLSLIMSIGMDHMEYLGNTLEAIAGEKGGIIKENCPVVLYPQGPVVYNVIRQICTEKHASLYFSPETEILLKQTTLAGTLLSIRCAYGNWEDLRLSLAGAYQPKNCAAVLLACHVLQESGLSLTDAQIRKGLAQSRWPGRMEVAGAHPLLLLDGAHNVDGITELAASLRACLPGQRVTLVLGVLGDKEYEKMTALLLPLAKDLILTEPHNTRRLKVDALGETVKKLGGQALLEKEVAEAVRKARRLAGPEGAVLCAGSLYLIGEIRRLLETGEL